MADANHAEPTLDINRHLKYWKMCLQAPLPNHYLSNEGVRMTLAYFIVNSIRILEWGAEEDTPIPSSVGRQEGGQEDQAGKGSANLGTPLIHPKDHARLRAWVLSHQQPSGGFAPSSTLLYPPTPLTSSGNGSQRDQPEEEKPTVANLPATLFSLQLLALLADDGEEGERGAFDGVDRAQILRWMKRLQRADGSFGEVGREMPGKGWFIGGGYDMRYCYIAASIRWMLRGDLREGEEGWVEDFDTGALERYILGSQTYDGGFAGSSKEEPHAGYAYCAVAALSLLHRPLTNSTASLTSNILQSSIRDTPKLLHWLASRQFVYLEPPQNDTNSDYEDEDNFLLPARPSDLTSITSPSSPIPLHVASNGRCNKVADTCYTWWVAAALSVLGHSDLIDWPASRRFLLDRMAHRIGGFSKHPGGPPDVYHGCFGLAALAVMGEEGLARVDCALALPVRTVGVVEKAREELVRKAVGDGKREEGGLKEVGFVDTGLALRGNGRAG